MNKPTVLKTFVIRMRKRDLMDIVTDNIFRYGEVINMRELLIGWVFMTHPASAKDSFYTNYREINFPNGSVMGLYYTSEWFFEIVEV